tara:strand:- start:80667 stop:80834 length:168 start_codon:yes stop_codon:yes gene_type:complete
MKKRMRTGKGLLCDGIFAIVIIFAMSACEQEFNTQKVVKVSSEKIITTAALFKKL